MLNNKQLTALRYLQSLFDTDEELVFALKGNNVRYTIGDYSINIKEAKIPTVNPIQYLLENVVEQMCTDCLKVEYNYKNEFFVDVVKAYINSLVHEFGECVPITRTLARAILKYELHPGNISIQHNDLYWIVTDPTDGVFNEAVSPYIKYYLNDVR